MKKLIIPALIAIATYSVYGQNVPATFVASVSEGDRMALVKTSIPLTEWHEKSFWTQYKNYLDKIQKVSMLTYMSVQQLAQSDNLVEGDAYENAKKLITYRQDELAVRKQYYQEIGLEHNGVIALQFLQTEAMLDMMETSRLYENSYWKMYRFRPKAMSLTQFKQAKYNTISKALVLTPEQAPEFFSIYARYEQECEEILGEEYDLYELFAGEASDFTPGLAKRQGYDLLTVMDREIKLKERYFEELNTTVGSSLAARFLAWEDYYSITCKMYAWVAP